jgi:hypothetical protein
VTHLTPEQFVDIAESETAESSAPHLMSCEPCRRQLAEVRAMMSAASEANAPEPSPLYWEQLSARVREAIAEERVRPRSWREWLLNPRVLVPSLAGALAAALLFVALPRAPLETTAAPIPATPFAMSLANATLPSLPPLPPLGAADDPQLGFVADYSATLQWDEMREEMALAVPGRSGDALVGALTAGEQRELQRLLAGEMAQPSALENRS